MIVVYKSLHRYVMCTYIFCNDSATTEIYTLSLHDALPILAMATSHRRRRCGGAGTARSICRTHPRVRGQEVHPVVLSSGPVPNLPPGCSPHPASSRPTS